MPIRGSWPQAHAEPSAVKSVAQRTWELLDYLPRLRLRNSYRAVAQVLELRPSRRPF